MNILFLSTWFPFPPDNGSKIRAHHLLRTIGERNSGLAPAWLLACGPQPVRQQLCLSQVSDGWGTGLPEPGPDDRTGGYL